MAVKRKTKKKAKKMDIVKAGRSKAYHYAIEYCDKLKTLYEKTGQKKEWKKLITFVYRFDGWVAASVRCLCHSCGGRNPVFLYAIFL